MLRSTYNNFEAFTHETTTYTLTPGQTAAGSSGISLSLSLELLQ